MDSISTIKALDALAHETRLAAFRLLIKQGNHGMAAGDIAAHLNVRQNTMSANLAHLARADLVCAQRQGRSIIYRANYDALRGLLAFLMEDCCGGKPDICQPIIDEIACAC